MLPLSGTLSICELTVPNAHCCGDVAPLADKLITGLCGRTAYYDDDGEIQDDYREIAIHYAKTWLAVDAIGCLPLSLLSLVLGGSNDDGFKALKMARLLRLTRMLRLRSMPYVLKAIPGVLSASKLLVMLMVVCYLSHLVACGWSAEARGLSSLHAPAWSMFLHVFVCALKPGFCQVLGRNDNDRHRGDGGGDGRLGSAPRVDTRNQCHSLPSLLGRVLLCSHNVDNCWVW